MHRFATLPRLRSRRDELTRFHATLKECVRYGQRLGTTSRTDGVWTYYQLGDVQYRFNGIRCVGPITGDQMRDFGQPVSEHVRDVYQQCISKERNPSRVN